MPYHPAKRGDVQDTIIVCFCGGLVDRRDRHRRRRWWDIETMMTRDTDQVLSAHPWQVVLGNNSPIFPSIAPTQNLESFEVITLNFLDNE